MVFHVDLFLELQTSKLATLEVNGIRWRINFVEINRLNDVCLNFSFFDKIGTTIKRKIWRLKNKYLKGFGGDYEDKYPFPKAFSDKSLKILKSGFQK